MKNKLLVYIAGMLFLISAAIAAAGPQKHDKKTNKPTAADSHSAQIHSKPAAKPIDGDAAYKANCIRCHVEVTKLSERMTATAMRHMRVRANLTDEETKAILKYLTQ